MKTNISILWTFLESSAPVLIYCIINFVLLQPSIPTDGVNSYKERDIQTWRRQKVDHKCECVRTEFIKITPVWAAMRA